MKQIMASIFAALMLVSTAVAQPQNNPMGIIPEFSLDTIEPILQGMGFQTTRETFPGDNSQFIRGESGQLILLFEPRACGVTGCSGLSIVGILQTDGSLDSVNAYNSIVPYSKAVYGNNQTLVFSRYLIADYGMTRGSFEVNIVLLARSLQDWFEVKQELSGQRTVSFAPLIAGSGEDVDSKIRNIVQAASQSPDRLVINSQQTEDPISFLDGLTVDTALIDSVTRH